MDELFLSFVGLVVISLAAAILKYLDGQTRTIGLLGLACWMIYTGALGYFGVLATSTNGPPGTVFTLIPVVLFVALFLTRSQKAAQVAISMPIGLLLGAQTFRIGVEQFLYQLADEGLAPKMLTYEGANFDILIGLSAPFVAWAFVKGRLSHRWVLIWNFLGIFMLANIVARAIMTAPGPLNILTAEVQNQAIGLFPYTFIPGLMAPLALTLHVLTIRALRNQVGN
ncbi:MAG: hypothetical protein EPN26_13610 [Rhodospirillales bacterium]|nr:MAG: hypothetical protein EPN26_13610 [Rhodospirillales bacterium]